ncbi:transmembrane protein, putative (macronuclear) [Tetrahymena thermophila SB210]|uniref:Transmembrane protein, putative n=1 Tax=Tetrahymena thermophila (strain SB210) TaxID=312017 RepID=W7X3D9_TETTS|nr:transmembrane protein, putative [Tetrahymena thermophila SB210]EWS71967.1 transmembrane protein, putative [Tetrahymena thermophila SB210]|eukprot:XP_012655498.1 transmembrane protein, putative [Tetrahymena thermophila SB210]
MSEIWHNIKISSIEQINKLNLFLQLVIVCFVRCLSRVLISQMLSISNSNLQRLFISFSNTFIPNSLISIHHIIKIFQSKSKRVCYCLVCNKYFSVLNEYIFRTIYILYVILILKMTIALVIIEVVVCLNCFFQIGICLQAE